MIAIKKDFEAIPPIIRHKARRDAFEKNKTAGKYCSSDNLYKPKKIKVALDAIYHRKCAYCEKSLKDADRHVEHYRPKVPYFWLAFSWDNLLIACKKCNELKNNKFTEYLEGTQLVYNNETLETAQSQIENYNKIEQPLIINPEQETKASLKKHFTFDLKTAEIIPKSIQMETTKNVCQLNREELIELREPIMTDLKNALLRRRFKAKTKLELAKAAIDVIADFKQKTNNVEIPFVAWRKFVLKNWRELI
ncbi:MAG: HNH endonuclease [Saprospiraceae bacterium]